MPASLRPNLLATLTLATTVSMTGCIFPFTRSSDTKLVELVSEDSQPQPRQQVVAEPAPAGEKKMPPFARFLGGMFGGNSAPQAEPASEPVTTNAAEPAARVATLPTKTPASQPSTIQPAQDLVKETPQTPIFHTSPSQMPVVVTPETNRMADKPDVVSRFSQKATQLVESPRPEVVVQPTPTSQAPTPQPQPQQQTAPETAPAPQAVATKPVNLGDDALDAHARSPWGERKLLNQAMANNSSKTTTLEHSLELALETVRRERLGQEPAPAVESQTPQPEMTASSDVKAEPAAPALSRPELSPPAKKPTKVAANPLRTSGTKTDWSGSSLRNQQPQTIVNETLTKYPQTDSKWSAKPEAEKAAPEEVAKQEAPAAQPQVTVNPYAKNVKEAISASPTPGPQLVGNTAMATDPTEQKPTTTDDIHFQSSLLNKLQAANRQAKWDFDTVPKQDDPQTEEATTPKDDMPQIVDQEAADSSLPLMAAGPSAPAAKPAEVEPKTTINPSVAQAEPEQQPQVIKPFIIAEPVRPARSGIIRAVEPQPLVMENQNGDWQQAMPIAPKQLPKLAPVVRASEYQQPAASNSGSKTYIVN
ncbi:hypothetical protein AB1K70_09780 [Bremerella sp. JC770]|uniref:hypothetical protein n=1 Tax=Bremerella sp. JC770 TaxID=3232137 RepID=UPI00345B0939